MAEGASWLVVMPASMFLLQRYSKAAAAFPFVGACSDQNRAETQRLKVLTSGWRLLYDAAVTLQCQGDISLSRGHEWDNLGRSSLVALLRQELSNPVQTPVWGRALEG